MEPTLEAVAEADRALVFGIGGGGDVVSTLPTARLLEQFGTEVVLGGVVWIPVPRDVRPGPRSITELEGIAPLAERVASVTAASTTVDGVSLAEAGVAMHVDNEVWALDISGGVDPLITSMETVIDSHQLDLVVGIDAGGDALAVGDEPGLRSPLTDAIGLAVLSELSVEAIIGVIGYGSDGELTKAELDEAVAELAADGALLGAWGITPAIRTELEAILETVETEASRIPVEAAAGHFGGRSIRGGRRTAMASPLSPVTLYFEPRAVASRSQLVAEIAAASSLDAAATALHDRGISTEFELERDRLDG